MLIFPAIDLRGRQVVRLSRGDFSAETVYGSNPVEVARKFEEAGARWVHVVDLDGATEGRPVQTSLIADIVESTNLKVQTGGGIRSFEHASAVLSAGVERIVVGTAAVENPELLERLLDQHGERIVVGIDAKAGVAATDGWVKSSSQSAEAIAVRARALGARHFVVTDIATDGMLAGPGIDLLRSVGEAVEGGLIASGGIATLDDLATVAQIPAADGVIIGRALYEGKINLADAVERFQER